ncbi:MAG TPA: glycosyltransferase family 4 protein [Candidatus Paceibacterota bacterium]|nr:glycosyltransferase family 4 protein [Candidatus Paceibacterota bacterium]
MKNPSEKEKFLFIAPRYHTNLTPMLAALREHGHDVEIFTLHRLVQEDTEQFTPEVFGYASIFGIFQKISGEKLIGNDFLRRFGFPPLFQFFHALKERSPDVIVIRDITNVLSVVSLVFGRWILKKEIVVLLQVNDTTAQKKKKSIKLAGKLFNAKVVTPLFVSPKTLEAIPNLCVIPFVMKPFQGNRTYFSGDRVNILSIGKYMPNKGQEVLLEAVSKLPDDVSFHLTFAGASADETYFEVLQSFAKEKKLEEKITWKKDLPWEEAKKEYEKNDVFVLPTLHEPASISVLEAMGFGLLAISSDGNGTSCYIKDGENGCVFQTRNTEDLKSKLEILLKDREKIVKMGSAAQETVREIHSPEKFYEKFIAL